MKMVYCFNYHLKVIYVLIYRKYDDIWYAGSDEKYIKLQSANTKKADKIITNFQYLKGESDNLLKGESLSNRYTLVLLTHINYKKSYLNLLKKYEKNLNISKSFVSFK